MKIIDDKGRIGTVTSETDGGVFAKPEDVPYKIGDTEGITGVSRAVLITATHWNRRSDGSLHGLWYDSPLGDFRTAKVLDERGQSMNTSYFGNKSAAADPRAVSIARWPPRWWGSRRRYISLAPSADLLKRSKAGLSWPEYVAEYKRDVLAKLDPAKVSADLGPDAILLCWESPGQDCHRRLVAEWLEKSLNIKIPEL